MVLEVAQKDHMHNLFLTRIQLAVKSQKRPGNQSMNIETIENP